VNGITPLTFDYYNGNIWAFTKINETTFYLVAIDSSSGLYATYAMLPLPRRSIVDDWRRDSLIAYGSSQIDTSIQFAVIADDVYYMLANEIEVSNNGLDINSVK